MGKESQKHVYFNLRKTDGTQFYYRVEPLDAIRRELDEFLDSENRLKTIDFAYQAMFMHEIKFNNQVEGIGDDVSLIERAILNSDSIKDQVQKKRILNLYYAYKHILQLSSIDREELRKLYKIISDGLLDEELLSKMGNYYRNDRVIIRENGRLDREFESQVSYDRLDEFMESYFNFMNVSLGENETDEYIKSQIMHFYFVYVHPYFDMNGRTSRTLAMWYLLNNRVYPYIIFNRGISFKGYNYDKKIMEARDSNDLTGFLHMMLETVKIELEKEYVIHKASEISNCSFTPTEYQTLLYFLSMNGQKTIFDFATMYNSMNDKKRIDEIYSNMIEPLLDKGVLESSGKGKRVVNGVQNKTLTLKPLDTDSCKVNHLNL